MTAVVPIGVADAAASATAPHHPLQWRRRIVPIALAAVALIVLLVALGSGAMAIPVPRVLEILLGGDTAGALDATIVREIRLPRALAGAAIGAALAVAGAALQVLFRNPLADPALVGVSSGAALATAIALIAPGLLGLAALPVGAAPIAAFAGGVAATLLALRLARRGATTSVSRLILVGVAINAVAGAGTGLLSMLATDAQLRSLSFWLLGSLGGTTWRSAAIVAPVVLTVLALLLREHRRLDLLLLGEREARHLGVPVERVTRRLVVVAALGVGAAVAVSGMIGFVGLLVPHAVRLLIGPTHRLLLPTTALAGAALLPAADLLARSIAAPVELPIGAVMALLGGPAFLVLVARSGDTT